MATITAAQLRSERNTRLAASDYLTSPDLYDTYAPGSQTMLIDYRQKLRDLPALHAAEGDSIDDTGIQWPEKPMISILEGGPAKQLPA